MRNKGLLGHYLGDLQGIYWKPINSRWWTAGREFPSYDIGIDNDGTKVLGRPLTVRGAHAVATKQPYVNWPPVGTWRGRPASWHFNEHWASMCICIGKPGDLIPVDMWNGMVKTVSEFMIQHGLNMDDHFLLHQDVLPTSCPGQWGIRKQEFINAVKSYQGGEPDMPFEDIPPGKIFHNFEMTIRGGNIISQKELSHSGGEHAFTLNTNATKMWGRLKLQDIPGKVQFRIIDTALKDANGQEKEIAKVAEGFGNVPYVKEAHLTHVWDDIYILNITYVLSV